MPMLMLAALLLAACSPQSAEPAHPPVVGGWAAADVSADVRAAADFAHANIANEGAAIAQVEGVETQVVAGTNYRFTLVLANGARWRVTVWRKLDGTHELTEATRISG